MAVLDLTQVDQENLEVEYGCEDGHYLAEVIKVDDESADVEKPKIDIHFKIIKGSVAYQQGRIVKDSLHLTEKAKKRVALFAIRTGLATKEEMQSSEIDIQFESLVGHQFVIHTKNEAYVDSKNQDKIITKLEYAGIYPVDHPSVKDQPWLTGKPAAPAVGQAGAKPATTTTATKAPAANGKPPMAKALKPGTGKPAATKVDPSTL